MVALGIDSSLTRTALASYHDGVTYSQTIVTKPERPLEVRLRFLADEVYRLVRDWPEPIGLIVMEEAGFTGPSASASLSIGRAQGAILAGLPAGIPIEIVIVSRWRSALGIHMRKGAGKAPIIEHVTAAGATVPTLGRGRPDDDVADAIGLSMYGRARQLGEVLTPGYVAPRKRA